MRSHVCAHIYTHFCIHVYTGFQTHVYTRFQTRVYTHACTHVYTVRTVLHNYILYGDTFDGTQYGAVQRAVRSVWYAICCTLHVVSGP